MFGLQFFANPGAQCLHRTQIWIGEKLLENVQASVEEALRIGHGHQTLGVGRDARRVQS